MSDNPLLALTLVRQLHRPRVYVSDGNPSGYNECSECKQLWPCETIKVIEGASQIQPNLPASEESVAPVGPTPRAPQPKPRGRKKR